MFRLAIDARRLSRNRTPNRRRNMIRLKLSKYVVGLAALAPFILYNELAFGETSVEGRVSQVTLYRGQALVIRTISVEGKAGSLEIVVGKLPEQVVPNSLFAEGSDAVEIRAVRFRTRAVGEQPREEVRKLDHEILEMQQQIDLTTKQQALMGERTKYLGKMEGFVVPTAHLDLARGVLNAE